jgi:hypothetical protein
LAERLRATQDRFLALTPSFIPDLRYDKDSKQLIGLAQWQESGKDLHGNNTSLVNQQEIALSKEFVSENFISDVLDYVRKKQLSMLVVLSLFQFQELILCWTLDPLLISNMQNPMHIINKED